MDLIGYFSLYVHILLMKVSPFLARITTLGFWCRYTGTSHTLNYFCFWYG